MKRFLVRLVAALIMIEAIYLGSVNLVLNLPATQDFVNRMQPEQFRFTWDRAWSWFPVRLNVTNLNGNFQTWSQQWEISVPEANGTLALVPLLAGTVNFYDIDGDNVDLRFRPRPRADRDDAERRPFYPTIDGRDPNLPAEPTPTQQPGMKLVFEVVRLGGQNTIWIGGLKTTLAGEMRATITQQTRFGPLSISNLHADVAVEDIDVNGRQVAHEGNIKGLFNLEPVIMYENRGLATLSFLSADAEVDLPIDGLEFLNVFFKPATGMTVGGSGAIKGRLIFARGDVKTGTRMNVLATDISVGKDPFGVTGAADLAIAVDDTDPETLNARFHFDTLRVTESGDDQTLFEGKGLTLEIDRSSYVLPREGNFGRKRVALNIPSMTVPDLTAYQRFLPTKWRVELLGGDGSLDGTVEVSPATIAANLTLRSDEAKIRFKDNESFETDLAVVSKISGEATDEVATIDISGTSLSLDDSEIQKSGDSVIDAWKATLTISEGNAEFSLPVEGEGGRRGFQKLTQDRDFKELLSTLDGQLVANLVISDLDWASDYFDTTYSPLTFSSAAVLDTDLTIRSGYLDAGSKVEMAPQHFSLSILDYVADGDGGFSITVEKGGEAPDLHLDAFLADASLRREEDQLAVIESVQLALSADTTGVTLKEGGNVTAVNLNIPSAKVSDMKAYNSFLPTGVPLQIVAGAADFSAKLDMQAETASGFVKFNTSRIETNFDGQRISGKLGIDVKINGGSAKDKDFDISGSSLVLEDLRGPNTQNAWNASIDLGKTSVVWNKPAKLDATGTIQMTDTRPLVAIFSSTRGKSSKLLDRILTLENVRADGRIKVEPGEVLIPYAHVKSDTVEIGAKGRIREQDREGMLYAKYGPISGFVAVGDGERHFGLVNSKKKFEEYQPGGKIPGLFRFGSRRNK